MKPLPQNLKRRLILGAGVSALLATTLNLSGCVTAALMDSVNQVATEESDSIFALGRPDANYAAQIRNPHAVMFLGNRHSYLVSEGGEQLMAIAQKLDSNRLNLYTANRALKLEGDTAWGEITIIYRGSPGEVMTSLSNGATSMQKVNNTFSEADLSNLRNLGFRRLNGGQYEVIVPIKAAVLPPIKQLPLNLERLKRARQINFFHPTSLEDKPKLARYLFLPFAVAADVVTSPLQLGLYVFVLKPIAKGW